MSTLALVAGCGSADRIEVSGVVRDLRTGTPLAGARVTGADGVATHTDAEGRFTIAVMRGLRTQLRVSAEGHADAVQSLGADALAAPAELAFSLEPLVVTEDEPEDPDAVVRWRTAGWVAERFSRGHAEAQHDGAQPAPTHGAAGWIDAAVTRAERTGCPGLADPGLADPGLAGLANSGLVEVGLDPRLADRPSRTTRFDTPANTDPRLLVGGADAPWLGAGAACVSCHRDGIAGIEANVVIGGSHAGLGDSCLSCHATDGAFEPASCARCHGQSQGVGDDTTHRAWDLELVVSSHPSYERAVAAARAAMERRRALEQATRDLESWLVALELDGSRGAHDPGAVRRLAEASTL